MNFFKNLFGNSKQENNSSSSENSKEPIITKIKRKISDSDELEEEFRKSAEFIVEQNEDFLNLHLDNYMNALLIKRSQLIYKDDYGDYVFDDWFKELDRFIVKKIPNLKLQIDQKLKDYFVNEYDFASIFFNSNDDQFFISYYSDKFEILAHHTISKYIERRLDGIELDKLESNEEIEIYCEEALIDPIKFEKAVAENFRAFGWEATTTRGSGDQGADVIAERNGVKWIAQCKLYSQPVGNKAIQEVNSAREYYKGHVSLVITNSTFTKSAQQLADSCNVITIHYSSLDHLLTHIIQTEE